jgi:hypothetical protein
MYGFRNDRYYCLLCVLHPDNKQNRFVTAAGVRIHLQNASGQNGHGIADPQPAVHYINGFQAQQVYYRRINIAEEEAEELRDFLAEHENYTVEDFLVDFKPETDG